MQPDQLDLVLSDLEVRMDRLRALYEQYFMGIERLEPFVPRKDVDRRVAELRKTRFPTTAKRFKFQTLVQKYNTMQQYWGRTCREIENGTYRRHRKKAERRFGTLQEVILHQNDPEAALKQEQERKAKEGDLSAREAAERDLRAMLDGDVDLDSEMAGALAAFDQPAAKRPTGTLPNAPAEPVIRETSTSLLGRLSQGPQPTGAEAKASPLGGLTLSIKPSVSPLKLPPLDPRKSAGLPPQAPIASPATAIQAAPSPAAPRPVAPSTAAPTASASASKGGPPPAPSMRPKPDPAALADAARMRAADKLQAAASARKVAAGTAGASLTDERLRSLHQSYASARERTNATSVSFEKLEKNIRETEQKLREKHRGRNVDFDVVIKDGKAILKPKLI